MKSVEQALKAPASELIRAASRPATTIPRMPTGSTCWTISGKAAWAFALMTSPSGPSSACPRAGSLPLFARASESIPGMMKMNTGRSFRRAAKIVPRRASRSVGAPSVRWTMYWSVHQYHRPTIGAQKSIPSQG